MIATPRRYLLAACLLAMGLVAVPPPVQAGWPFAINGQELPSLAPMLEKITPGVVNIASSSRVETPDNPLFRDPLFRKFFSLPRTNPEREQKSLGSGVVVDAKAGTILTNNHVVDKADQITVTLRDGRSLEAKLVGKDPDTDIAVIQVKADNLVALPMGDSDQLKVGDFVVAIGNPFGLGQTVTSGIVSALGRKGLGIEGYEDFIQTDASINPGNSGGALINLKGELIGINTAILAPNGGNVGIGFAIPISMAKQIMAQLVTGGRVHRGMLGIQSQDLTPKLAEAMGITAKQGAVVSKIVPDSSAQKAGLHPGDVVIGIDDQVVQGASHLRNIIGLLPVGKTVQVKILREGKPMELAATVAEPERQQVQGKEISPALTGATLENQKDAETEGTVIMVTEVEKGSTAWRIGLRPEDQILAVNRVKVATFQDMVKAVAKNRNQLLLNLLRGEEEFTLLVR